MLERLMPDPEPPRKIIPSLVFQSRIDSIVSWTERMKQAEHWGLLLEPDVEPHRAVEGRFLVKQDVGQLGLEGVGVLVGCEVAAVAPPAGDRPGDPGDHLLHGALALRRAELAAEVLLGDDVGRVLGPALRELDLALLERGVLRIADHRVADLPLDLVEGVDAGLREAALHRQSHLASLYVLCSGFSHQCSPSSGIWGKLRILARGPDGTGGAGTAPDTSGSDTDGSVPANWRYAPQSSSRSSARQSWPMRSAESSPPPVADRDLDPIDDRLEVGGDHRAACGRR